MFRIKTHSLTVENAKRDLLSIQPTATGCYFKFADGSELIVQGKVTTQLQAALTVVSTSQANNIEVDFTNPNQPIKMGPKVS
jgi:hypothetical protein